jgi:NADH dehydrogenase FAD-containing subunit
VPATARSRPRVVVIGGGFAGLWAVRALRDAPADVLLIDRHNHHTFKPLLYQVATAGPAAPSIAAPLRHILRKQANVTVQLGEVHRIDVAARKLHVANAVVDQGRVRFSGVFAWWFWLLAHVYFLIGFRNRTVVLIDWASAYWTYQRGARIVTGADPE